MMSLEKNEKNIDKNVDKNIENIETFEKFHRPQNPVNDDHEKLQVFRECWKLLHSLKNISKMTQYQIFLLILEELKLKSSKCSCSNEGSQIMRDLLLGEHGVFENHMENTTFFWWWFHNEINMKLKKEPVSFHNI